MAVPLASSSPEQRFCFTAEHVIVKRLSMFARTVEELSSRASSSSPSSVRRLRGDLDQKLKEKEDADAARVDAEISKFEPESLRVYQCQARKSEGREETST